MLVLEGDAVGRYVTEVGRVLRAARLNRHYPDARRLASHVECLGPAVHGGLYERLEVDPRSGLPSYKEWTRVRTDREVAPAALEKLDPLSVLERKAAADPGSIRGKQLLKHHYYTALLNRPLAPLSAMDVALRRVDPAAQTAWFHVVLDKLDASGLFVRFSIDLAQQASVWNRQLVRLDESDETASHTEELRTLVYRFTALDAEFTWAKIATQPGLTVERVVKGTVGPLFLAAEQTPPALAPLLAEGALLATFALDMAANDVAEDRDNDPLDDLLTDALSEEGREGYERVKQEQGFRVVKDRKFVVSRELVGAVRAFCQAAGTKNIVYPA